MVTFKQLITRLAILSVAFILLSLVSLVSTTLVFQSDIHPDNWTATKYDEIGLLGCMFGFLICSGIQVKRYLSRSNNKG